MFESARVVLQALRKQRCKVSCQHGPVAFQRSGASDGFEFPALLLLLFLLPLLLAFKRKNRQRLPYTDVGGW